MSCPHVSCFGDDSHPRGRLTPRRRSHVRTRYRIQSSYPTVGRNRSFTFTVHTTPRDLLGKRGRARGVDAGVPAALTLKVQNRDIDAIALDIGDAESKRYRSRYIQLYTALTSRQSRRHAERRRLTLHTTSVIFIYSLRTRADGYPQRNISGW